LAVRRLLRQTDQVFENRIEVIFAGGLASGGSGADVALARVSARSWSWQALQSRDVTFVDFLLAHHHDSIAWMVDAT
jgi:hypothetical protein